jgi:predicted transcriptional regulator
MEGANQMSEDKPTHRYLTIKAEPDLLKRIDELAAADKRSRTNWLTLQIERIAHQQLTERAA